MVAEHHEAVVAHPSNPAHGIVRAAHGLSTNYRKLERLRDGPLLAASLRVDGDLSDAVVEATIPLLRRATDVVCEAYGVARPRNADGVDTLLWRGARKPCGCAGCQRAEYTIFEALISIKSVCLP